MIRRSKRRSAKARCAMSGGKNLAQFHPRARSGEAQRRNSSVRYSYGFGRRLTSPRGVSSPDRPRQKIAITQPRNRLGSRLTVIDDPVHAFAHGCLTAALPCRLLLDDMTTAVCSRPDRYAIHFIPCRSGGRITPTITCSTSQASRLTRSRKSSNDIHRQPSHTPSSTRTRIVLSLIAVSTGSGP